MQTTCKVKTIGTLQVQDYSRIVAASAPAATAISQGNPKPPSMAGTVGENAAGEDWYNQVLSQEASQWNREKAAAVPNATSE